MREQWLGWEKRVRVGREVAWYSQYEQITLQSSAVRLTCTSGLQVLKESSRVDLIGVM